MSRLVHSESGLIRSLQISGVNFFAFVEGGLDRPFVDRLLTKVIPQGKFRYQVISAKELPGDTGGKPRLVRLFQSLRARQLLTSAKFGKRLVNAFFLDKDIDDLLRRKLRSPHVIYTSAYDLEGELFHCGNLPRAVADASGMTMQQAQALLGIQNNWLASQIRNWTDWTVLCVIGQTKMVNVGCNFDRLSIVNPNLIDPVDVIAVSEFKVRLANALNLTHAEFDDIYKRYRSRLEKAKSNDETLRQFKGKWFKAILEKYIASKNAVPDVSHNGLGERVMSTLVAQVGVSQDCQCCRRFEASLLALVN